MRCGGDRDVRVSAREGHSLAGHRIEVGSESALGAEESHAIGAGGVEGDEDDVGMRRIGWKSPRLMRMASGLACAPYFQTQQQDSKDTEPPHGKRESSIARPRPVFPELLLDTQKVNFREKFMLRGPPWAMTGLPTETSEVWLIWPKFPPLAEAQVLPTTELQVERTFCGW